MPDERFVKAEDKVRAQARQALRVVETESPRAQALKFTVPAWGTLALSTDKTTYFVEVVIEIPADTYKI